MRRATFALAFLFATVLAAPAPALLFVYTTSECFAFWKLKEKLDRDGVGEIVNAGPKGPDGGLPEATMQRVTLYLDLEEKLRFRCPDFAPPPDRAPGKRPPATPPVVTANPGDAAPAAEGRSDPAQPAAAQPPAAVPPGSAPLPVRRPPQL